MPKGSTSLNDRTNAPVQVDSQQALLILVCSLPQTLDIADGIQTAVGRVVTIGRFIAVHRGYMVRAQHAIEAYLPVGAHTGQQIRLAFVVEVFHELLGLPAHVTKMHESDLL